MWYQAAGLTCTVLSLVALGVWWEYSCRLDCIGSCWRFYLGMPILTLGWLFPRTLGGVLLECLGASIMVDSAFVLWRRGTHGPNDYTTPLWRVLSRLRQTLTGLSRATTRRHHRH